MKANSTQRILMFSIIVLLLTAACIVPSSVSGILQQAAPDSPGTTPGADDTIPDAPATKIAAKAATSTATMIPTATASPYPTLRPSSTPWPTFTPVPRVAIPRPRVCDQSGFVSDVTIPDGSSLPGGVRVTKTWKIKNTGTCTWSSSYSIGFYKGDTVTYTGMSLPYDVEPGEIVEVSVAFTTPTAEGNYRTHFQLKNSSGKGFLGAFYVDYKIDAAASVSTDTPDPKVRYEFAGRQCDAIWLTSSKTLSCPGTNGSSDGFMLFVSKPVLESGYIDNEPGLLMNPPSSNNSFIHGAYPPITILPGDSFRSIVGCERGASKCDVRFELSYISGDLIYSLGTWSESYNEAYTQINIDLTPLAGQTVYFVLTVHSNGVSDGDRGLWLRPRIYGQ